ncbi:purine-nucleoside phosphorylase [bacterium]|nr:MAG: purine-nucleoside phosphorylase [bacterium]
MTDTQLAAIKTTLVNRGYKAVDAAVILGSGLGGFENNLERSITIPYHELDGLPETTVVGHSGSLSIGYIADKCVLVFAGRFHHYEGHSFDKTVIPVKIAHEMGAKLMLVSNAAGGINLRFNVGDLMLIDDFVNTGFPYNPFGERVLARYKPDAMLKLAKRLSVELGIPVQQGTYLYVTGPSYETKAEIRAFRLMGGDAVGMSTAPELNYATKLGIECLGITLVTNMATGVSKVKLDHAEIKEVGELRKEDFKRLVSRIIEEY